MHFHIALFFLNICLKTAIGNEELFIRIKISSDSLKVPKTYSELKSVESKIVCGARKHPRKPNVQHFCSKNKVGFVI